MATKLSRKTQAEISKLAEGLAGYRRHAIAGAWYMASLYAEDIVRGMGALGLDTFADSSLESWYATLEQAQDAARFERQAAAVAHDEAQDAATAS